MQILGFGGVGGVRSGGGIPLGGEGGGCGGPGTGLIHTYACTDEQWALGVPLLQFNPSSSDKRYTVEREMWSPFVYKMQARLQKSGVSYFYHIYCAKKNMGMLQFKLYMF